MTADVNLMKTKILEAIEAKASVFKRGSNHQYRIRCHLCGDSDKNMLEAHLYLKCSTDPTEPILFKCFKCGESGRVNSEFLRKMDVQVDGLDGLDGKHFNRLTSIKTTDLEVLTGSVDLDSDQARYVDYRLGDGFTREQFDRLRIVWDMNAIVPFVSSQKVKNTLPNNSDSISFLSDDKSMLLTRFWNPGRNGLRWKKTRLFPNGNRSFYTIKGAVDLFGDELITVHAAEGIFDVLSVFKNFPTGDNSVYLAFLGMDYEIAMDYILAKGLIGGNVALRFYLDEDIDPKYLKYRLQRYRWLFHSITTVRNARGKDFGLKIEDIKPIESKV